MPRTILTTTAPGAQDQWTFSGATTSWEAVGRGSGDTSYIAVTSVSELSDFFCGSARYPVPGLVTAVTLHYRMRQTVAGAGSVDVKIVQSGTPHTVDTVVLSGTGWVDGEVRIREDWVSGTRFVASEIADLGVGVESVAVPALGSLQVSELWLAVEYWEGHFYYDPYWGVTPDAVTGPRAFIGTGSQPATITGSNYLRIDDTSTTDFKTFLHQSTDTYRQDYVTETEVRCTLSNLDAANPANLAVLAAFADGVALYELNAVRIAGALQLGLTSSLLGSPTLAASYKDLQPVAFDGRDMHLRIKADRDTNPSTYGKLEVFLDYDDTPLLSTFLHEFPAGAPGADAVIGTPAGANPFVARVDVDYLGWRTYKKRGETFRSWKGWDLAGNAIVGNVSDPDIVKPILIDPPGLQAGQSEHACVLDVQDVVDACEVMNDSAAPDVAPTSYKIDVIYKMDIAATEGELRVQRSSDLYYWDEGGSAWDPSIQSVTLPNQLSRTQYAAMTGINVTSSDEKLLVTVSRKTTAGPAYKIFVYKVHLVEE